MIISLSSLNSALKNPVTEVCADLGYNVSDEGTPLSIRKGSALKVSLDKEGYHIIYRKKCEIFRGVSMLGRLEKGKAIRETGDFNMLCYMADASRNAVPGMKGVKELIRTLAVMGYDSFMLYTEDTYEVEGYPYFGHMRGRYTEKELKEIDRYAASFGIEAIPCIQTLAHLTTAIRWPGLASFSDTGDILLAGDERTYDFVRACLKTCKKVFRTSRINIGMDEAHNLGLGRYLKLHGYVKATEIMTAHLERVAAICKEEGFEPMMWSDMFFRMAFGGAYRVREGVPPQEVYDKVPDNVTLVYWDYYSLDRQIFDHMVDCHINSGCKVAFAGGAWKWSGFAPHNKFSIVSTRLQLDSCAERGMKDIIVTGWGDNGGEASQFSTLPSLLYFAERLYTGSEVSDEQLNVRACECFGTSFDDLLLFDLPNDLPGTRPGEVGHPVNPSRYLLYNDVLEGLLDRHQTPDAPEFYANAAKTLLAHSGNARWGYIYKTLGDLCSILAVKCDLGLRLTAAYKAGDREAMWAIAHTDIPTVIDRLDSFIADFRVQWYRENKTFGFGTQEQRLGGLRLRLQSAQLRIDGYLAGDTERIEELEQPRLWVNGRRDSDTSTPYICYQNWNLNVNPGLL